MTKRVHHQQIQSLLNALQNNIVGQKKLLERLIIGLLSDGHILVEGAPGLAKSLTVATLAKLINCDFQRIQFTPDLLPSDITGSEIYKPQTQAFSYQKGPIFSNLVLADEINRAPAKVQSALLEAMSERQVTIGNTTYTLPALFQVMATQNPIEHEGTFQLPEAQLDRFIMYVAIDYPSIDEELMIMRLNQKKAVEITPVIDITTILQAREEVREMYIHERLLMYIAEVVHATRTQKNRTSGNQGYIEIGAGPRASIALATLSRSLAYLRGQDEVTPDIIQELCYDVLAHRIILNFSSENTVQQKYQIIDEVLSSVKIV